MPAPFVSNLGVTKEVSGTSASLANQHMLGVHMNAAGGPSLLSVNNSAGNRLATSLVSNHLRVYLNEQLTSSNGDPKLEPTALESFAVVIMADVSGYSKLSSILAERGAIGAEILSKTMKGYLDKIIKIVLAHDGDIIKFAGDAVIIDWKADLAASRGVTCVKDGGSGGNNHHAPTMNQTRDALNNALNGANGNNGTNADLKNSAGAATSQNGADQKAGLFGNTAPGASTSTMGIGGHTLSTRMSMLNGGGGVNALSAMTLGRTSGMVGAAGNTTGHSSRQMCGCTSCVKGATVLKGAVCCLELLQNLGKYKVNIEGCSIDELNIHLGIGAGQIFDMHVRGDEDRWEHFIVGEPMSQLGTVLNLAKPEQLALSHPAYQLLSKVIDNTSFNINDYDKRCIILTGFSLKNVDEHFIANRRRRGVNLDLSKVQDIEHIQLYQKYINTSALYKLQGGIDDFNAISELRQVTTIFISLKLPSVQRGAEECLFSAQMAMQSVQRSMRRYEGILRQFNVDDKGAVIICFFGLPPLAHDNDAYWAMRAAVDIRADLNKFIENFSIGVTTGTISIGGVGSEIRTEYALMGDSINMAARLMAQEKANDDILCDERTYQLCRKEFDFENLGSVKVKGKNHPIEIYRPMDMLAKSSPTRGPQIEDDREFRVVGREQEKQKIREFLDRNRRDRSQEGFQKLVVEGEGGHGVTTMARYLMQCAKERNFYTVMGRASELERTTPFNAFQEIVCDLFKLIDIVARGMGSSETISSNTSRGVSSPSVAANMPTTDDSSAALTTEDSIDWRAPSTVSLQQRASQGDMINPAAAPPMSAGAAENGSLNDSSNRLLNLHEIRHVSMLLSTDALGNIPKIQIGNKRTKPVPPAAPVPGSALGSSMHLKNPTELDLMGSALLASQHSASFHNNETASYAQLAHSSASGVSETHGSNTPLNANAKLQTQNMSYQAISPGNGLRPRLFTDDASKGISFEWRIRSGLSKMGEAPTQSALFSLMFPMEFQEDDQTAPAVKAKRMRDLTEVIKRLFNMVSLVQPVVIVLHEAQWADALTWDLSQELLDGCPRVTFAIFSRPEKQYLSPPLMKKYVALKLAPRTMNIQLSGLSEGDMLKYIVHCYDDVAVKSVSGHLVSSVVKRSNGNCLHAKAVMHALKDANLLMVTPEGLLTMLGRDKVEEFEKLMPSLDLQSVIIAQFDRLDPAFQQLLKTAAVIGRDFLLADVLHFLSVRHQITEEHIQNLDRYGYLKRVSENGNVHVYGFKSTIVRQCIYSMMMKPQQQLVHHYLAKYYEDSLDDSNRNRLLVRIYEHYRQSGSQTKARQYLAAVAHHYFEQRLIDQAITHYETLMSQVRHLSVEQLTATENDRILWADWTRELGECHLQRGVLQTAEKWLTQSLRVLNHPCPENGRAKHDVFRALSIGWKSSRSETTPTAEGARLRASLLAAAHVYAATGRQEQYAWAVQSGISASRAFRRDAIYAEFLAMAALVQWDKKQKKHKAWELLLEAETICHQEDEQRSMTNVASIGACMGKAYIRIGKWPEALVKFGALVQYAEVVDDYQKYEESMVALSWIFFMTGQFGASLDFARKLYARTSEIQVGHGRAWAIALILLNHLYTDNLRELPSLLEQRRTVLKSEDREAFIDYVLAAVSVHALYADGQWDELPAELDAVIDALKEVPSEPYTVMVGHFALITFVMRVIGNAVEDASILRACNKLCSALTKAVDRMPSYELSSYLSELVKMISLSMAKDKHGCRAQMMSLLKSPDAVSMGIFHQLAERFAASRDGKYLQSQHVPGDADMGFNTKAATAA